MIIEHKDGNVRDDNNSASYHVLEFADVSIKHYNSMNPIMCTETHSEPIGYGILHKTMLSVFFHTLA